nr:MAG TPA: hypothetical protein [Herelleviridae sp.]
MYIGFNDRYNKTIEITIEDLKPLLEKLETKTNYLDISKVQDTKITQDKPILQFNDYDNRVENICNVKDLQEGLDKMVKIFKDSSYTKHYYTRVIDYDNYFEIDYGSHNCFFRVTKTGNENLGELDG